MYAGHKPYIFAAYNSSEAAFYMAVVTSSCMESKEPQTFMYMHECTEHVTVA